MEQGQEEACVHIYATMGLYEEAVDLSLQVRGGVAWVWCEWWVQNVACDGCGLWLGRDVGIVCERSVKMSVICVTGFSGR